MLEREKERERSREREKERHVLEIALWLTIDRKRQ